MTVDEETGEILEGPDDNEASLFDNLPAAEANAEPEILAYDHSLDGLEVPSFEASPEPVMPDMTVPEQEMLDEEDDNEPLEVDFTAKANLLYKLPTIDLFAPDKPKNQSKEKNLVRRNIKVLEDTFNSFGIDVKVERAEIGPSVTKYEVKPAVEEVLRGHDARAQAHQPVSQDLRPVLLCRPRGAGRNRRAACPRRPLRSRGRGSAPGKLNQSD